MAFDKLKAQQKIALALLGPLMFCWLWSALFHLLSLHAGLAPPWEAPYYAWHFSSCPPTTKLVLIAAFFAPFGLSIALLAKQQRRQYLKSAYGDAHFATFHEIKQMGLFKAHRVGLIIGEKHGRLLQAPLTSHALVFAPSRSGKGVSQVIPNALAFPGSMLVVDIKHEIFQATSGFRAKHGQAVFLFSPASLNTHRWDPLSLVRRNPHCVLADIEIIADTLISYAHDADSMWALEARALFKGLLLWLMESGRPFTLGELTRFIKATPNFTEALEKICNDATDEAGNVTIHPVAFANLNSFIQKAEKEQSGVKSTLTAKLHLWDDPVIAAATAASDFDLREMRKKPITIYLGIATDQLDRLAPLMNLFIQLFVAAMARQLPTPDEPCHVLAVLDEFCALGRMDKLKNGFGFLAGYHVHLMAVIQNLGQFYGLYGGRDGADVFLQNTDYKILYRQNTKTDQEFVSQQLGTRAVKSASQSFKAQPLGKRPTGGSEGHMARPLLAPEEVRTFPTNEGIALMSGQPPVRYQRILYYQDRRFSSRVLPPIDVPNLELPSQALKIERAPLPLSNEEIDNTKWN